MRKLGILDSAGITGRTLGRTIKLPAAVTNNFLDDISLFCGATDTPVLDLWSCLPLVAKHASSPLYNRILRSTSGATPANIMASSMEGYACVKLSISFYEDHGVTQNVKL